MQFSIENSHVPIPKSLSCKSKNRYNYLLILCDMLINNLFMNIVESKLTGICQCTVLYPDSS